MRGSIRTAHFGEIEFAETEVLQAPKGLPGFAGLHRFLLIQNPELEPFKFLQSLDDPVISFPLIDPRNLVADYHVALNQGDGGLIGLTKPEEALILSIVTLAGGPEQATANLLAPLVINTSTMLAAQVIMLNSGYAVAEPLLGA